MTKVVNIEPDQSPDTLIFLLDQAVEGQSICVAKGSKAADAHPLGSAIFAVSGASSIFCSGRTIRVTKECRVKWSDLIDPICAAIESEGSVGSEAPGQRAVWRQVSEENPFIPAPLDSSRFPGRSIDRKLAKRKGFTKRSIDKVETWLETFRTVTDSCHSDKIVIGVYVQVDGAAAIKNIYADVQLLTISLMGEGRMEPLGNVLFGDDRKIAYEMIDAILTPESGSSQSPESVATLPTKQLEAI